MFDKAKRKVETLQQISTLHSNLAIMGEVPKFNEWRTDEIYDYAIKFFNAIVKFQDACTFDPDDFKGTERKKLKSFEKHIANCGRDKDGFVRAPAGEKVTEDNLFFGGYKGLWTYNVREWKKTKDVKAHKIIHEQISNFINSHYKELFALSTEIVSQNKPNALQRFVAGNKRTRA